MTPDVLKKIFSNIQPLNTEKMKEAAARQEALVKPPGSLGVLEEISIRLAGITGEIYNNVDKTAVEIFVSDNGVACKGTASAPQSVTYTQALNFLKRQSGVGALSQTFGTDLLVTDVGCVSDFPDEVITLDPIVHNCSDGICRQTLADKIVLRKIAYGTADISEGPAMTAEDVCKALYIGLEASKAVSNAGYGAVGIGEMGIGNTTTSAAVLSAVTGLSAEETVGKGGGINSAGFEKKKNIVKESAGRIKVPGEGFESIAEILRQVGGFDIAAMTGAFLGAALYGIPVVIDGYISAVAALCAVKINPLAREYMFASHKSAEAGYMHAMKELKLRPLFDLDMRLGEGSGCPLAFQVMKAACGVMNKMATFEQSEIDTGYLDKLDRKEDF